MKIYKRSIYVTGGLTIITFAGSLFLHYIVSSKEAEFWCNILLGIFSGSILTLITSIIGYRAERRRSLEKFYYYTNKLLKQINQYQLDMTLEEKIDFLLEYADSDKIEWDSCLGDIDFFRKDNFTYIFHSIYEPLLILQTAVQKHDWHFKWYKDGTAKNDNVMEDFLAEIEPLILDKKEDHISGEFDESSVTKKDIVITSVSNRIVEKINTELHGKYYKLMYNKEYSKIREQVKANTP